MSTIESPSVSRRARRARWAMPSGSDAPDPVGSLDSGTPKRIRPGTPREARRLASATSEPRECWHWPGMAAIGAGSPRPSRTKSGATTSSTEIRDSATSRRMAGVVRSRRSRRSGNPTASAYGRRSGPGPSRTPASASRRVDEGPDQRRRGGMLGLDHPGEPRLAGGGGGHRADAGDERRDRERPAGGIAQGQVGREGRRRREGHDVGLPELGDQALGRGGGGGGPVGDDLVDGPALLG